MKTTSQLDPGQIHRDSYQHHKKPYELDGYPSPGLEA